MNRGLPRSCWGTYCFTLFMLNCSSNFMYFVFEMHWLFRSCKCFSTFSSALTNDSSSFCILRFISWTLFFSAFTFLRYSTISILLSFRVPCSSLREPVLSSMKFYSWFLRIRRADRSVSLACKTMYFSFKSLSWVLISVLCSSYFLLICFWSSICYFNSSTSSLFIYFCIFSISYYFDYIFLSNCTSLDCRLLMIFWSPSLFFYSNWTIILL